MKQARGKSNLSQFAPDLTTITEETIGQARIYPSPTMALAFPSHYHSGIPLPTVCSNAERGDICKIDRLVSKRHHSAHRNTLLKPLFKYMSVDFPSTDPRKFHKVYEVITLIRS